MTSEIRANKQTNRAGLGTVTYADTGIIVSGIVTCTELSGLTALNIAGVGTASTLDINGDIDVDGHTNLDNVSIAGVTTMTGRLQIDSGDLKIFGTAPTLFLRDTNDNPDYRIMNSHGSYKIFDETNGVDRFTINPVGKVSILKDLDVDGHTNLDNVSVSGITTFSGIIDAVNTPASIRVAQDIQHKGDADTKITFPANDTISFETAGDERLRITSSGDVGIGEDSPVAKVHIAGSNYVSVGGGGFDSNVVLAITRNFATGHSAGLALNSGTNATSFIHLGDADDPDIGKITYDHSSNYLAFTVNTGERLRIESGGDVGIGTDNPHKRLHVAEYGTHGAIRVEGSGNGNRSGIEFYRETSAGVSKGGAAIWVESDTSSSQGKLRFGTASNAAVQSQDTDMILDNNGRLGIGSEIPQAQLDVTAGGVNNAVFLKTISDKSLIEFENSAGATYNTRIGSTTLGAGNVGLLFETGTAAARFQAMVIDRFGKVGINEVSNINGRLHVQHDALAENILYATRYNDQANDKPILAITEAQMNGMSASGLIIGNHNRAIHIGPVFDASATVNTGNATGIRILYTGNVGINQDTPTAKLHIVEATSTTAVKIKSGTNSNQNTHITMFNDNDVPLNLGVFGSAASTVGTIAANTAFMTSNSSGGLAINASNASGVIKFGTGSSETERLRIDSYGVLRVGNTHTQTTSGNTKRIALGAKASIWGWASGQINGALTLADNYYWDGVNNKAIESDYSAYLSLRSGSLRFGTTNSSQTGGQNISGGIHERFRISSEGYVTKPNNPIFFAYMDANTNHNSGNALKLDHTELNVGSGYNTSNYRFTPPVNGHYMFHGSANLSLGSGDYTRAANVRLYKNGSLLQYQTGRNSLTGYQASYPQVDGTFMVYGTTSDYFECRVTWETGTGSNLNTSETLHQHGTKFMGYLIG